MKICVCIPTFNRSHDLVTCLKSLLKAGVDEEDIFIFDNKSNQEHKERITQFTNRYRINITFNKENLGLSGNLEKCLSVNGYDYIVVFEDHDIAEPNFISCLKSFAENYPKAALIIPERKYINSEGQYLYSSCPRYIGEIDGDDFIRYELRNFTFPFPMCVMVKSKNIENYNLKRFNWYGDIYAWLSLALSGSIVFTNKHLYLSRAREDNHPLNLDYMKSIKEISGLHKSFIKDNLVGGDNLRWIFFVMSACKKIFVMDSKIKTADRSLPLPLHYMSKLARWVWIKVL